MKRKLVKQGAATLMVSLPAKWIQANGLDKGSEVGIEEAGNKLIIEPEETKKRREIILNISSLTETSVRTMITNAYRMGYDKIKINFKDKNTLKIVEDVIQTVLMGFEISKFDNKSCILESITEPSKDQFDNVFSKLLMNIDALFEAAEKNLSGSNEDYKYIELKIKQFDNFCRRVISKHNFRSPELIWVFHTKLIHAQREIYLMLNYISKKPVKANKLTLNLLKDCKELFDLLKKGYLEKDIASLEKIHDREKEIIYKKGYDLLEKKIDPIVVNHILWASRNFYLASSPLMGTNLLANSIG